MNLSNTGSMETIERGLSFSGEGGNPTAAKQRSIGGKGEGGSSGVAGGICCRVDRKQNPGNLQSYDVSFLSWLSQLHILWSQNTRTKSTEGEVAVHGHLVLLLLGPM